MYVTKELNMSEQTSSSQVSSLPLPPMQYVNLFTEENIKRGRAPKPPPPVEDSYTMFGTTYHADDAIVRPLESQGIRRLYPQNYDHKKELKKLNYSILVNFLDLLDILIKCPEAPKRKEKIEDINLLFIHMHHLINEFRPHQARETLRVLLEVQKQQRLDIAHKFETHLEKVQTLLQNAISNLSDSDEFDMDSKLFVPIEAMELDNNDDVNARNDEEEEGGACSREDLLMCHIVDSL
ncbi:unnamed protein product [Darwinula stevensoni]|uniref:Mediator of RNA polymerase II transcription subunit 7 n=1 Tax=Darwinula stevensoni TaxID=69355 RepID=A0A7R8X150_9CRUS|nr:unnamed protein product [Darwinula stevensoni]CAG0879596.1 unnamed protein product [Darwinula stevensoni]